MATLQMKIGPNLGNILLEIAQRAMMDGDPQKAVETYTKSLHGFTEEYAVMLFKNEAVLITDEDGVNMSMTTDEATREANKKNITDWNWWLKSKLEDMRKTYESMKQVREAFEFNIHHSILDYNLFKPIKEYFGEELAKTIGVHNIAAKLIAGLGFDDNLSSNGRGVWEELCENAEGDDPKEYEFALNSVVKYSDCVRYLHKDYMGFIKSYDFLMKYGLAERPLFIEEYLGLVIGTLDAYSNTKRGYYHPMCNEALLKYKMQLRNDISSTSFGKEHYEWGIIEKNILDGYDAGWLSPDGKFYGENGEASSMIHLRLAEQIVRQDKDSDRVLEKQGWVKIHHDEVYGSFIGGDDYAYCPTEKQVKAICDYIDKFYNGKFYTQPQIVKRTEPVTTYKLRQMDIFKLHETFCP